MAAINKPKSRWLIVGIFFIAAQFGVCQELEGTDGTTPDTRPAAARNGEKIGEIDSSALTLEEVTVTATRTHKAFFDVPNMVDVLSSHTIRQENMSRSVPEALKQTPGIMVQKTAHGQGSPYIRGFTGLRTLFLIDGIRLNNSVLREGPNQYWNTVDVLGLHRLDIVRGPGSVLYGSGAVGGVVDATMKRPDFGGPGIYWKNWLNYRFSSAEQSHMGRVQTRMSYGGKWAVQAGLSPKRFGDLKAGGATGIQPKTGYKGFDGDVNLAYRHNDRHSFTAAYQSVHLDDAWRTHKTVYGIEWEGTGKGSDLRRSLDQNRRLSYLKYTGRGLGSIFQEVKAHVSLHRQKEEQFRITKESAQDRQGFNVITYGTGLQFETHTNTGRWTYGMEYYRDQVSSFHRRYDISGGLTKTYIQGPVGDEAVYDDVGLFIQDELRIFRFLDVFPGVRASYFRADAGKVEEPQSGNRIRVHRQWRSMVGSLRFMGHLDPNNRFNLFWGLAQGFRAPNLSDLTRLDNARTNEYEIPSPEIGEEKFLTSEIGVKTQYSLVQGEAAYFFTVLDGMILRTPTGESFMDNGQIIYEVTKKNSGDGYIHGFESRLGLDISKFLWCTAWAAWLTGEVDTYPNSLQLERDPLSRLMPVTARFAAGIRPPGQSFRIHGVVTTAGEQDKLSVRDRNDKQRIPPGGTPGYLSADLYAGWKDERYGTLTLGVENLFDANYRIHGSGINEPGRNFVAEVNIGF